MRLEKHLEHRKADRQQHPEGKESNATLGIVSSARSLRDMGFGTSKPQKCLEFCRVRVLLKKKSTVCTEACITAIIPMDLCRTTHVCNDNPRRSAVKLNRFPKSSGTRCSVANDPARLLACGRSRTPTTLQTAVAIQ